jgi:hypothetical protein
MAPWTNAFRGFVAVVLLASASDPSAQSQSKPGIEIRGTVVDGVDGTPVEGVRVRLIRRSPVGGEALDQATLTDERGAFVLSAPSPGEYSISAYRAPLAFGEYGKDPFSGSQRWFPVSGRTAGIVIKLWKSPQVNGTVVDESDQPLANVIIRALRIMTIGDRRVLTTVMTGNTAPNGRYALDVVSPGRYLLQAVPRLSPSGPARFPQYHPNSTRPSGAAPVDLVKGQATTIDFRLKRERGFVVSGRIDLPADMVGPNTLDLFDVSDAEMPASTPVVATSVSTMGTFSFPLVPVGLYEIRFVKYAALPANAVPDGAVRYNDQRFVPGRLARVSDGQTWWAAERVSVIDDDVSVLLRLQPGVRVSGRMVFEGPGDKLDSALLPTRGIRLQSTDHRFFRPFQVGSAGENGVFSTVPVPPGRYVLGLYGTLPETEAFEGYQLESVKVGGREVAGVSFELNQDVRDATLTFSSRPTVLMGSVSGQRGDQRSVLVWPDNEALWTGRGTELGRLRHAITAEGTYRLSLLPGSYRVVALEGLPPPDWESSEYLRRLLRVSGLVDLAAGQTTVRNLVIAKPR